MKNQKKGRCRGGPKFPLNLLSYPPAISILELRAGLSEDFYAGDLSDSATLKTQKKGAGQYKPTEFCTVGGAVGIN
jgi:hypothetical protein